MRKGELNFFRFLAPGMVIFLLVSLMPLSELLAAESEFSKDVALLKKKIESVGKLKFKREVPLRYMNRTRLNYYVSTILDRDYSPGLDKKEAWFFRAMGFIERNTLINVKETRRRIMENNVGGIYNERTKEFVLAAESKQTDYLHSMLLVHELRHALQDQYFDLTALLGPLSDFDDRKLARIAAMEGDATFVMVKCSDLDAEILTDSFSSEALMSFAPIPKPSLLFQEPAIVKFQLMMPYIDGLRFVNYIYRKKKWRGVNKILKQPPLSTEQILHPEKYLLKEPPMPVVIRYQPGEYHLFHAGVIGEYLLNVLLKPKEREDVPDIAQGWAGDTFHLYTHDTSFFLAWESQWDEATFCSDFYTLFKQFIENRFQVEFKEGMIQQIPFIAGVGKGGFFFLRKAENKIFYARSDNKEEMNKFIYGGIYD